MCFSIKQNWKHWSKNDPQKLSKSTKWTTEYYKSRLCLISPAIVKDGYLNAKSKHTLNSTNKTNYEIALL